jgi:hypothetical protein
MGPYKGQHGNNAVEFISKNPSTAAGSYMPGLGPHGGIGGGYINAGQTNNNGGMGDLGFG